MTPAIVPIEATDGLRDAEDYLMAEAERLEGFSPPDPAARLVRAMAVMARAQNRLVVAADLDAVKNRTDIEAMIREARKPWTGEELIALTHQLKSVLVHQWTRVNRYAIGLAVVAGVAITLLVAGGVWWGMGGSKLQCQAQQGGRLCFYWADPPTAR